MLTLSDQILIIEMFLEPCYHDPLTTIRNEETFLQDFLVNPEEIFPLYYMESVVISWFISPPTQLMNE